MNCTYKHCRYDNKEIKDDDVVRIGKRNYHSLCAKESNDITQIKKLYYENISKTVVQSILGKVINDIIYSKNVDSSFLLFALKYSIQNNFKINSPYGLHYIIDNNKIKSEWTKIKSITTDVAKVEIIKTEDLPFYFNPSKQINFNNIIKE